MKLPKPSLIPKGMQSCLNANTKLIRGTECGDEGFHFRQLPVSLKYVGTVGQVKTLQRMA